MILVAPNEVGVATLGLNAQVLPIPRGHPFGVFYFEKHTSDTRYLFHLNLLCFGSRVAGFPRLQRATSVGLCCGSSDAEHCDPSGERSQKETVCFDFPFYSFHWC